MSENQSLTNTLKLQLKDPNSKWILELDQYQTFDKIFSELLKAKGLKTSELGRKITQSPFNRVYGVEIPDDEKAAKKQGLMFTLADSNARKMLRWSKGEQIPEDRDLLFQICLLMGATGDEARMLFYKGLQASWVHAANPKELIYGFCLDFGFDIQTAFELAREYCPEFFPRIFADIDLSKDPPVSKYQLKKGFEKEEKLDSGMVVSGMTANAERKYLDMIRRLEDLQAIAQTTAISPEILRQNSLNEFENLLCDPEMTKLFHTCRVARWKLFSEMFDNYMIQNAEEDYEDDDEPLYGGTKEDLELEKEESVREDTISALADALTWLDVPDPKVMETAEEDADSYEKIREYLQDESFRDKNAYRHEVAKFQNGERDVPRDVMIKMYLLTFDKAWAKKRKLDPEATEKDIADLNFLLQVCGYAPLYVRASGGLDALVYHLLSVNANVNNYAIWFKRAVRTLRQELAKENGLEDTRLKILENFGDYRARLRDSNRVEHNKKKKQ